MLTDLTSDDWHAFYDPIEGVQFVDNTIRVPTSTGGAAVLTLVDTDDGPGFAFSLTD